MKVYIGLDAPIDRDVIHLPLIGIVPKDPVVTIDASYIIVTSKTTVLLAKEAFQKSSATFISVGAATTAALKKIGVQNIRTAINECQEGIVELIEELKPQNPKFFWAHSSRSRPLLRDYLAQKNYPCIEHVLYDTVFVAPTKTIDFDTISDIHFASSSCVDAFFHFYGKPPAGIQLHAKGHVTERKLMDML